MSETPKSTVRVAVIGAGSMANSVHYPSLASFDDVEIAGICDLDTSRLNATGDKYGIQKRYANYRQMVEEVAPDGIYVIGQPHYMYDIWVWCLQQGLNLYIEKADGPQLAPGPDAGQPGGAEAAHHAGQPPAAGVSAPRHRAQRVPQSADRSPMPSASFSSTRRARPMVPATT